MTDDFQTPALGQQSGHKRPKWRKHVCPWAAWRFPDLRASKLTHALLNAQQILSNELFGNSRLLESQDGDEIFPLSPPGTCTKVCGLASVGMRSFTGYRDLKMYPSHISFSFLPILTPHMSRKLHTGLSLVCAAKTMNRTLSTGGSAVRIAGCVHAGPDAAGDQPHTERAMHSIQRHGWRGRAGECAVRLAHGSVAKMRLLYSVIGVLFLR